MRDPPSSDFGGTSARCVRREKALIFRPPPDRGCVEDQPQQQRIEGRSEFILNAYFAAVLLRLVFDTAAVRLCI